MRVYIAAPFGTSAPNDKLRQNANEVAQILQDKGCSVYCPWEMHIPHAWDYPNDEWAQMVFITDVTHIDQADLVVVLSYGRTQTTAGTNWEAGYAYGIGKTILLIEMNNEVQSLMVANGRYATISDVKALKTLDLENLKPLRTKTEQC